jgi:hypothetical protein
MTQSTFVPPEIEVDETGLETGEIAWVAVIGAATDDEMSYALDTLASYPATSGIQVLAVYDVDEWAQIEAARAELDDEAVEQAFKRMVSCGQETCGCKEGECEES